MHEYDRTRHPAVTTSLPRCLACLVVLDIQHGDATDGVVATGVPHDTGADEPDELTDLRLVEAKPPCPAHQSCHHQTYGIAVASSAFLLERGMPAAPRSIAREHVESFVEDLLARWKPATAHNRYRGCQAFFRWLVDEGEIRESPMARMKPPRLPEAPPPVLRENELRAVVDACARDKDFTGRRDEAIVRVFIDTGARRGEVLGLTLDAIDLDGQSLRVTGKGSRTRLVAIGAQTVKAIDRYLRARTKHPDAARAELWLGRKGRWVSPGSPKSSGTVAAKPVSPDGFTRISSVTPTRTRCWPPACRRPT